MNSAPPLHRWSLLSIKSEKNKKEPYGAVAARFDVQQRLSAVLLVACQGTSPPPPSTIKSTATANMKQRFLEPNTRKFDPQQQKQKKKARYRSESGNRRIGGRLMIEKGSERRGKSRRATNDGKRQFERWGFAGWRIVRVLRLRRDSYLIPKAWRLCISGMMNERYVTSKVTAISQTRINLAGIENTPQHSEQMKRVFSIADLYLDFDSTRESRSVLLVWG
ncbi:hypothetical protein B7494_g2372 [Chlorociboria aeruginascens]|nr:hypothetical protein B7494_g2372 [Chlorociboria aeruginascens]